MTHTDLVKGQKYNIVYYLIGGGTTIKEGVFTDHQQATATTAEKYFFSHGDGTCAVVTDLDRVQY
jgi:hypothetical protein